MDPSRKPVLSGLSENTSKPRFSMVLESRQVRRPSGATRENGSLAVYGVRLGTECPLLPTRPRGQKLKHAHNALTFLYENAKNGLKRV